MNRKDTLEAIRAAGMAGTYDAGTREYRVTYTAQEMPDKDRREAVASYTDDPADAIGTAKAMRFEADRPSVAPHIANMTAEQRAALVDEVQGFAGHAYEHGERGAELQSRVADALVSFAYFDPRLRTH